MNRDQIKYVAMFTMLLNHIANVFLEPGTFLFEVMVDVGYFTAITMCYFLVEGYGYTRSKEKYGKRLLLDVYKRQFLILLILLIPFTRFLVGKSYGTTATIVPLTIAAIPFIGRMVESSLNEVDPGVIEAARSMGASNLQIVFRVMLVEARTSLISGATIVTGTILGYSAMAGTVGGGGLGDIAVDVYKRQILVHAVYDIPGRTSDGIDMDDASEEDVYKRQQ